MKRQEGDLYPLSLEDILDETNQTDVSLRNKHWLTSEVGYLTSRMHSCSTDW